MKNKLNLKSHLLSGVVAALALSAIPASAQVDNRLWKMQDPTYSDMRDNYYNFAWTAATGRNFSTWTTPTGQSNAKYIYYDISNISNPASFCLEISTSAVSGVVTTTDTRIFAQNSQSTWASINDDISGANNRLSRIRVWLPYTRYLGLRIGSFDANYNNMDFRVNVNEVRNKTSADAANSTGCGESQTLPLLDLTNAGWPVFKRAS